MIDIQLNPYKSIVVIDNEGELITISEGDTIQFEIETTKVVKQGIVTKFISKDEKLKIQMVPKNQTYEEIWPVIAMKDGSLKLVEDTEEEND